MEYVTPTQLATICGTSRTTVHAWLAGIGLLTLARQPSEKAIQEGFCKGIANNAFFLWHRRRTVAALRATYQITLATQADRPIARPPSRDRTRRRVLETPEPSAPERDADWDQTPVEICRKIIELVPWADGELVLEPFRGTGNFYRNLPGCVRREWCEISQGRDFFRYQGPQPDTIITNPPFRTAAGGNNLVVPCLERCLQVARRRVVYFVNHKVFNSLTPNRLQQYEDWAWAITHLSVWDVRKWFGRYFLIVWERDKPSIIGHFSANDGAARRAQPLLAGCAVARS